MKQIALPHHPPGFYELLGTFHANWQALDILIDFAIGQFRGWDSPTTLANTRSLIGKKLSELRLLVLASDHENRGDLIDLISRLFAARRNEITHSYLATSDREIRFSHRNQQNVLTVLHFTGDEFATHVVTFLKTAQAFQDALDFDPEEVIAFGEAASIRP